ncbi:Vacuolar protein-sorting-associated protein 36 [Mortierella sp. GBA43]|nr:Vacuolar protein-sorting-associated protein 36 [Mortierella sp. GBA43]
MGVQAEASPCGYSESAIATADEFNPLPSHQSGWYKCVLQRQKEYRIKNVTNEGPSDNNTNCHFRYCIVLGGIMRTVETNKKATDDTLSQAFQDLQGLMHKAKEMVALAETISKRLAKSNTMDNEETATFKTYLLSMGIASPVTKDTAGAVFHKELARELVEFILPLVEREGGTMSLMDVYCVFNRARGVELISPKDLHTACQLFSELNLPLRLRKFDSGLLVIQTMERYSDDEVSVSITNHIQDLPPGAGLTAVELAGAIQISVALAQEQLLMTEARGLICRDETVDGLRFYDNLFAKWEI